MSDWELAETFSRKDDAQSYARHMRRKKLKAKVTLSAGRFYVYTLKPKGFSEPVRYLAPGAKWEMWNAVTYEKMAGDIAKRLKKERPDTEVRVVEGTHMGSPAFITQWRRPGGAKRIPNPRRNAHISGPRYIAGTPKAPSRGLKAIPAGRGRKVQNTARRLNPPGSRKIGDRVTKIKTTKGMYKPPGNSPIYGLKDGSVFIRGFFTNAPPGYVEEIWYMADGKARREGYKENGIPWKHDVKEKTILQKTRGGLIMRRGNKPLWGMR